MPSTAYNRSRASLRTHPVSTIWSRSISLLGIGPRTGLYYSQIAWPSRPMQTKSSFHPILRNASGRRSHSPYSIRPFNRTWTLSSGPPRPWRNSGRPSAITRAARRRGPQAPLTIWWRDGRTPLRQRYISFCPSPSVAPPPRGSNGDGSAPSPKTQSPWCLYCQFSASFLTEH